MTEREHLDAGIAAARAYERLHVPAIFAKWPPHVLDAARIESGQRVLDVACGTGVLARAALQRVGPTGSVAGVDPMPGMLSVASELAPQIDWCQGTAEALPHADDSFDAVVSQFGLMFFADRDRAIREMLRVVRPGGAIAVAVWDRLERCDAYRIAVELLERMAGARAADALRAPFTLGDEDALRRMFRGAGIGSLEISEHCEPARFPSLRTLVEADLRGWLPVMGVELEEELIQAILAEAENALASLVEPNGEVVFDAPALVVRGVAGAA